jgi:hypothetical protein
MMTQSEIREAANNNVTVVDFDDEQGIPTGEMETDGETIIARIVGNNFDRWSDTLDLRIAD